MTLARAIGVAQALCALLACLSCDHPRGPSVPPLVVVPSAAAVASTFGVCGGPPRAPGDSDGDGVPDGQDACPCAPGACNPRDSPRVCGCPYDASPRPLPPRAEIRILARVEFAAGSATISPAGASTLDRIAAFLEESAGTKLVAEGHTDDGEQRALGEQRAAAVVKYLVDHRVQASRLSARGLGATRPIGSDRSPDAPANARRVEFQLQNSTAP